MWSTERRKVQKLKKRKWIIMLLPMLILLWIVGWTMFWAGSQENTDKTVRAERKDDGISIIVAPIEEITV